MMDDPSARLTRRQREIAALIGRGYTNQEIARELALSRGTTPQFAAECLRQLGLKSRPPLAAWAVEHGLTRPDEPPTTAPANPR